MGRAPCCDKGNVKKGPWSPEEDAKLKSFIDNFGTGGNWIALPQKIGLKRCGKSCRLRWLNYLRPNIKHGGFSQEEETIIFNLYRSIGSRWSLIAAQLPGRTDNDIKNYWNTKLKKKLQRRDQKPPPYPYPCPKQEEDNVIKWECDNNNTFIMSTDSVKLYSQSVSLYPEAACNYWEETILPNIHHQSVVKSEDNDGISAMLSSSNNCGFDSVVKDDSPYYYYYNFVPGEFQEEDVGAGGYKNILCRTWDGSEDISTQLPSASPAFSGYKICQNNATEFELLPDYTSEKFGMQRPSSVHELKHLSYLF